jgi:hypothetical protein
MDRYSTSDGWTCSKASDTLGGTEPESVEEPALVLDASLGGLSAEATDGEDTVSLPTAPSVELTLEFFGLLLLESNLDDITRV